MAIHRMPQKLPGNHPERTCNSLATMKNNLATRLTVPQQLTGECKEQPSNPSNSSLATPWQPLRMP